jgi:hypothetical protein
MLETGMRFTSPIPASRRALSKALSRVGPSDFPEVKETFIFYHSNTLKNLNREKNIGISISGRGIYKYLLTGEQLIKVVSKF